MNQPSKNEQAARHFLRSHGIAGNLMVRPLLDLLDRTEADARAQVAELERALDDKMNAALLVISREEVQQAQKDRIAELERQLDDFELALDREKDALAASRIEAARLREVLETLAVETVHFNSAAHHECRICGRSSPHGAPPIAHLETCVLAATSESAAAWLAEVQRKELERAV